VVAAGLARARRFFLPFGVALRSSRKFARRIEQEMKPVIHLFTPIFFVMVGLSLSLHEIDWGSPFIWLFSPTMLFAATAGKLLGAFILNVPIQMRGIIGTALTTLLPPFIMKWYYGRYRENISEANQSAT